MIVVGSLNLDRPWRVERHPAVGETILGEQLEPVAGGKGLNQAVAAKRMGADTMLIGRIGDDAAGQRLRTGAEDEGIDTTALTVDAVLPTGAALIVVDDGGANTVTVAAGANAMLTVDALYVRPGDLVIAQLEIPVEAVRDAFTAARAKGATTMLNPSPVPADRSVLELSDVLVVNEHEAAQLAGASEPARDADAAINQARDLAVGGRQVVVTLGSAGVVAVVDGAPIVVEGRPVEPVDTVGAGDCFLGALAARLSVGESWERALEIANAAAARSVTRPGAVDAMPQVDEVLAELSRS